MPLRVALAVVVSGALGAASVAGWGGGAAEIAVVAVLGGALAMVRSHPRGAWGAAAAALLVVAPFMDLPLQAFVLVGAHAFCAARWASIWTSVILSVAMIAALEIGTALDDGPGAVPALIIPTAGWLAGRVLGERDELAARLAARVHDLSVEREAHAQLSVRYERARIASELHDIVAHALSVMVVQAGAGQRMVTRDPAGARQSLDAIADAAQEAERDLGRLIDLLADETPSAPAPDLAVVEELVAHAAASGVPVTLELVGPGDHLPVVVAELGYRIVQEGLTNAMRHAPGAPVSVVVRTGDDVLRLEVSNGPASASGAPDTTGTGNGLRGLRERVGARSGHVEAAATPGGGWRLAATLPTRTDGRDER